MMGCIDVKHPRGKRAQRILQHSDLLKNLLSAIDKSKFNIVTLQSVFEAFTGAFSSVELNMEQFLKFPVDQPREIPVFFDYENKTWRGAIILVDKTVGKNKWIQSINFKMPNDGFLYTDKYDNGEEKLISEENDQDVQNLMEAMIDFILKLKLDGFEIEEIDPNYKVYDGRLDIAFIDYTHYKRVTVGYENGFYEYYNRNRPVYSREKVKQMVEAAKRRCQIAP